MIDYHCHVLPGVDDGVKTVEESLKIIKDMSRLGTTELWLTPHIMGDIPNTTDKLTRVFRTLQAYLYEGSPEIHLAAEYMLDCLFEERLAKRDLLPLGKEGSHLLVETSYFNPPMDMDQILENIKQAGYHPVLAHPERYIYMNKGDYKALKKQGVLFQMNLGSFAGAYGKTAQAKAKWLLKKGMYDICGTDLHHKELIDYVLNCKKFSTLNFTTEL